MKRMNWRSRNRSCRSLQCCNGSFVQIENSALTAIQGGSFTNREVYFSIISLKGCHTISAEIPRMQL